MLKRNYLNIVIAILSLSSITACSSIVPNTIDYSQKSVINNITKESVIDNYSNIVFETYKDSLESAKKLQQEIKYFVSNPSEENFTKVKKAWIQARVPYNQTEAFKFYDGPIDGEENLEARINAYNINEVLIDYINENKESGIINNKIDYPEINEQMISELNKKDTVLGFHVIEFLLWGQDLNNDSESGKRKYTDYLVENNNNNLNQDRRGKYLVLISDILVDDLQKLVDEWDINKKDNYRSKFKSMNTDLAINKIIKGIGTLSSSEISSKRMNIPLQVGEGEEEISCFSDNTKNDLLYSAKGIENVFMGNYTKLDGNIIRGNSIYELLKQENPEFALKLKGEISSSIEMVSEIKNPFDQEIRDGNIEGNNRVRSASESINNQSISIFEINSELNLNKKD